MLGHLRKSGIRDLVFQFIKRIVGHRDSHCLAQLAFLITNRKPTKVFEIRRVMQWYVNEKKQLHSNFARIATWNALVNSGEIHSSFIALAIHAEFI